MARRYCSEVFSDGSSIVGMACSVMQRYAPGLWYNGPTGIYVCVGATCDNTVRRTPVFSGRVEPVTRYGSLLLFYVLIAHVTTRYNPICVHVLLLYFTPSRQAT